MWKRSLRRLRITLVGLCLAVPIAPSAQGRADHPVRPSELSDLIRRADRLVVLADPERKYTPVYSSTDSKDLEELASALVIAAPPEWTKCACMGDPVIRLYCGGVELVTINNHGARTISTPLWDGDAIVTDPERWLAWFDARSITRPREEFERDRARAKAHRETEERWLAAMPSSLRPLWNPAVVPDSLSQDTKPLQAALEKEIPNKAERIRALLAWYGSGEGPWSGYPAYEGITERLLLAYSTAELLAAVGGTTLSSEQLEGTARLFGGWDFSRKRPGDLARMPTDLKRRLLEHALASADEDKRQRARRAFGP